MPFQIHLGQLHLALTAQGITQSTALGEMGPCPCLSLCCLASQSPPQSFWLLLPLQDLDEIPNRGAWDETPNRGAWDETPRASEEPG